MVIQSSWSPFTGKSANWTGVPWQRSTPVPTTKSRLPGITRMSNTFFTRLSARSGEKPNGTCLSNRFSSRRNRLPQRTLEARTQTRMGTTVQGQRWPRPRRHVLYRKGRFRVSNSSTKDSRYFPNDRCLFRTEFWLEFIKRLLYFAHKYALCEVEQRMKTEIVSWRSWSDVESSGGIMKQDIKSLIHLTEYEKISRCNGGDKVGGARACMIKRSNNNNSNKEEKKTGKERKP